MPSLRDCSAGGFVLEGMPRELPQMQSGGMAARKFRDDAPARRGGMFIEKAQPKIR
jgi:hypothetical protein